MNLNSQYEFYPPQPDNPTDEERHLLLKYALTQRGWPEDMQAILERMAPPLPITSAARPGSFKNIRVGVMGGGLAGLAAAYELRKMGFDITVFDALTDRIGGRVYTYYFGSSPGQYGEFGPMRIPVSHETVWHYLREFGLKTYPFIQYNPHAFIYLRNTRARNDRDGAGVKTSIYPRYDLSPWERAKSWQELLAIGTDNHLLRASTRERIEIIEVKARYSEKALQWINRSNLAMMEAGGLSQSAIDLVANFNPLLEGNLYSSFIDFIQESYPADMSYLYAVEGGTAHLPAAFYRTFFDENPYSDIPRDAVGRVTYRPGCLVTGVFLNDGGTGVTLRYGLLSGGENVRESFDYVVCAIPFSTLRNVEINPLFSGIKMRAIREVNYTPAQKTILHCNWRFWEKQGIAGGASYTDLPIGSIWYPSDHTRLIVHPDDVAGDISRLPAGEPGVMIGSFNFNLDTTRLLNQPDAVLSAEVIREVAAVHGLPADTVAAATQAIKYVNWNQEPTFRGALAFFTPEQKRIFSYGMALPEYEGRVFFAGEHISAVHRWMQGSLQTGMLAADALVKTLTKR
ncbi:monoamine oxidase [Sporobacter termitidis DSM 10068]|uniref:Monoamine oxidase n=1 Tax=Sporobacter termitidis DSM 10068 TaxID=1123282 RepID=A0A1M5XQE7_9FIRM|nr:FAD-dependent oxidoreductase [Sporobacter termitidis]SHI01892.1 monoamine oxidase [Sporobacter termitidis DSM 10068]